MNIVNNQKIKSIFKLYLKECPDIKTTIQWYDLYAGHYIQLNKAFQKEIFKKAVSKAGSYSELGRILNISRKTISHCSKGITNPQITVLKKIADYTTYPLKTINNKIIEVSGLKPKLPFKFHNKEGAEIRAAFLSDGHVDKYYTKPSQYCAYEKELHERLITLCKNIFGEFKAKTYFNSGSNVTKFPAVFGKALELSGVSKGDKGQLNSYLPKDILLGNKEIQTAYLRRIFDDEGDVCFDKYGKRAVRLTRSTNIGNINIQIPYEKWVRLELPNNIKHNLIFGEQILLSKLGIDARLYREGVYKSKHEKITAKWRIQIAQQDNLRKFAQLINFNLDKKRKRLNKIIHSYQFRKLPNGKGKEEVLEFIKKVLKKKDFFKFDDLGKELIRTGRSYDLAGRYLKLLLDERLIKKIKRGVYLLDKN